ncbi:MAG: type II toxin-antitoxin system VapC family toxin [Sphingomonadaceae bacterium]
MKLLLDTNIIIMLIDETERLSRAYLSVLDDPENEFCVSTISVWEMAIKQRKGKLDIGDAFGDLEARLWSIGILVLPLNILHALADSALPRVLKDPFDRMFVAIAEIEGMQFLTIDTKLLGHPLAWRP